jgi:D-allulose-6-phosphate 3-epimerase
MEVKKRNIKIAPSLICMDFLEIGKQISVLNELADSYHCDISDNHFAPTFGLPLEYLVSLKKISTLPIEVHLVVDNLEKTIEQLLQIEINTISIHIESIAFNAFRLVRKIKDAGIKFGIVVNPITPLESLNYVLSITDKVTVMTFDPGPAGQKLVEFTLEKVSKLSEIKKAYGYAFDLEVDGSCNEENFYKMFDAGANQFVVGTSGLFSLDNNIEIAWSKMKKYMNA